MNNEPIEKNQNNLISAMNRIIQDIPLENLKAQYNEKTRTVSISGNLNGVQYTTTLKGITDGVVKTTSQINTTAGKEVLINQVKDLRRQGYKQVEIANMLNISQPTVSKYLNH